MNYPLEGLFGEGQSASMMRFLNFVITGVVLWNWSFINFHNVQMAVEPVEMIGLDPMSLSLVLGALGIKAYQKGTEIRGAKIAEQPAPNYKIIMSPPEEGSK
ncbi:MAG: hypothetical protein GY847_01755 [Proteobacteria bacterium]|nr:hypothetical protein [Pseudomonadota bacterium]